jgi:hypothetical protein
MRLEEIRSIEKFNNLIGNGTRYLLACSIVPQPTTLPRASRVKVTFIKQGEVNRTGHIASSRLLGLLALSVIYNTFNDIR